MKTNNLGKILKELRENKGLSQKEIAQQLGISATGYAGYEQNYRDPDLEMLKKIAIIFTVTTDYLLGLEDETGTKNYKTINTYNNYGNQNGNVNFNK